MKDQRLYLMHYGISGQKWHVRRFQNYDRSLTPAGKERYGSKAREVAKSAIRKTADVAKKGAKAVGKGIKKAAEEQWKKNPKHLSDDELNERLARMRKESEYTRLQSEIYRNQHPNSNQNNNQGGGKKDGNKKSKHPYLAMALLTPIAKTIGDKFVAPQVQKKVDSIIQNNKKRKAYEVIQQNARRRAMDLNNKRKGRGIYDAMTNILYDTD